MAEGGLRTWTGYMEPFCIFGNLYFVGCRFVCSHIIDTGEGLILIDSSYPQTLYLVTEGMRKLGLDPADIKYVLHSHGHYDHIGGTRAICELYGAKSIIGREDVPYVTGEVDLTWAKELGFTFVEEFEPDIILDDGDIFELGNTKIRAVSTPGHTPGTMSFFFNVTDGKDTYTAAMFGGGGINSLKKKFLEEYNLPLTYREAFPKSIEKVWNEKVDITIGNHPGNVKMKEKYEIMKNEKINPYIDPTAWRRLLTELKASYDELIKSGE